MYIGKTRSPLAVILLSVVTCGIYYFYWLYTIMDDLNKASDREIINPALFLVLSIFCGPFIYYVFYTVDRNLGEISRNEGTPYKENFIIWLILTLVCSVGLIMGMYQITEGFNEIWAKRYNGNDSYNDSNPNAF